MSALRVTKGLSPTAPSLRLLASLTLLGTLTACSDAAPPDGGVSVRDSAGVTIVENRAPRWGDGDEWRLAPEPTLTIGVLEGLDEYQLFRVAGARRLSDGRIAVVNTGTSEIRFYDAEGGFLHSIGRSGEGPGEFLAMSRLWPLAGDSLALYDFVNVRVTVLTPDGQFARDFRVDQPGTGVPFPRGTLDGRWILAQTSIADQQEYFEEGPRRDSVQFFRYDLEGAVDTSLGRFQGSEQLVMTLQGRLIVASVSYAREEQVALGSDVWYYGTSDSFQIEMRGLEGDLLRIIRLDLPNRPIPARVREEHRLDRAGTMWEDVPLPETLPAYEDFMVDDAENLWVAKYLLPDEEPEWFVFDPEGRYLGNVITPLEGRISHIGADFVLGTWRDEMDVQRVMLYPLIKR